MEKDIPLTLRTGRILTQLHFSRMIRIFVLASLLPLLDSGCASSPEAPKPAEQQLEKKTYSLETLLEKIRNMARQFVEISIQKARSEGITGPCVIGLRNFEDLVQELEERFPGYGIRLAEAYKAAVEEAATKQGARIEFDSPLPPEMTPVPNAPTEEPPADPLENNKKSKASDVRAA